MKKVLLCAALVFSVMCLTGCDEHATESQIDTQNTIDVGNKLANNQPTPTDIDYSQKDTILLRELTG